MLRIEEEILKEVNTFFVKNENIYFYLNSERSLSADILCKVVGMYDISIR